MKKYSVFVAPAIKVDVETSKNSSGIGRKIIKKIVPNGAKYWHRIGTIETKSKKLAMDWLKKNQKIEKDFVFVVLKSKIY